MNDQALVSSVQQTNDALSDKVNSLGLSHALINSQFELLSSQTRQGRSEVEDISKKGASLDYRMGELERGAARMKETLESYRRRNREMKVMARAVVGDDSPDEDSDAGLDELGKKPSKLRHRRTRVVS